MNPSIKKDPFKGEGEQNIMMNSASVVGRLTKDVDLKYTPSGTAVANVNVAVNRTYKTEGQPEADFIPVVIWNKQAENVANYVKKGNQVAIEGRLQTRSYEDSNKVTRYIMELVAERVHFLETKKSAGQYA